MKITQIEQILIGFLKTSKLSKGKQALVFIQLKTEAQMMMMCEFLSQNEDATEEQIIQKAAQIAAKNTIPA